MIGVLLAGGQSKRYGSPKAFAKIEDQYFYERAYDALKQVCDEIFVVSRKEHMSTYPQHLNLITDEEAFYGFGPLAGINAAMAKVPNEQYFILPCDMPFLHGDILIELKKMASRTSLVNAVKDGEQVFPLVSIWDHKVKPTIEQHLHMRQLSVMKLLQNVSTTWIEASQLTTNPQHYFNNINTPYHLKG